MMMNRGLRVLAFPKHGANAYLRQLAHSLETSGATVDEFSFPRAFFGQYDILHLHWPDGHLRARSWWRALGKHARLFLLCASLRLRRTRIAWVLHNLTPHEPDHWISRKLFALWFPRLCTHVIALTPIGLNLARACYPPLRRKAWAIVPHGHYRDVYPVAPPRRSCRSNLGLPRECFTFLFFGNIRAYKNVPRLIETFGDLPDQDVRLVVAGQPLLGVRAADIAASTRGDPRVRLDLRFIEESEVPVYFGAADLVVLPFEEVLNSGSVLLALSFNRPVLAPHLGALPDVQRVVGERWLRLYHGALTAAVLAQARQAAAQISAHERADLCAFDWAQIGDATLALYKTPPLPRKQRRRNDSGAIAGRRL